MTPKRDPYPIMENVPEHIVIRARQMVAKRVNPEAKWFYMQGKGDHFTVVQAVIEALMDSENPIQSRLPSSSPADTIPAGTGQPVADLPAGSNSIDAESFAAWRESQGQPIDAEPRAVA